MTASHEPVRVLVVDDLEPNLVALEAALHETGVEVVRARSGNEALGLLRERDFALILLDVQMPEMDGFETAAAIRESYKSGSTPIIFVTAYDYTADKVRRAFQVGGSDLMAKPLDSEALCAKVRAFALAWRRIDEARVETAREAERRLVEERGRWEAELLRARIAEEKRATAAEHAARLVAESANRLQDEFLSTVSHELRTPLNAILGWASVLRRRVDPGSPLTRGLDAIERNAHAQARLITDLLDTSAILSGSVQLNRRRVRVAEWVTAVLQELQPQIASRHITLETFIADDLPDVHGDLERLRQVLDNLLSNAVRFLHDQGRITVSVDATSSDVRIRVTDDGVGISPEFLPHLFNPFSQAEPVNTRKHGGLGLGLSVARQLALLHGGDLAAESAGLGMGTTFTFTLPAYRATTADRGPDAELVTGATSGPSVTNMGTDSTAPTTLSNLSTLSTLRVLVVDDDADAREWLMETLLEARAQVITAASAAAGFATFITWRPHLVVSDIAMPGEDGFALIARIRASPEDAASPVLAVALTAHAGIGGAHTADLAGFDLHLEKPITAQLLLEALASLVAKRRRPPSLPQEQS